MGERIRREKQPTNTRKLKDFNATHKTAPNKGGGVKKQRSKQKARKRPEFALFILFYNIQKQHKQKQAPKQPQKRTKHTRGGQFITTTQKQRTARTKHAQKQQAKGTPENGKQENHKNKKSAKHQQRAPTRAPKRCTKDQDPRRQQKRFLRPYGEYIKTLSATFCNKK